MDRQTRAYEARLALEKAEGSYRTRGAERHAAREVAKARRLARGQMFTCAQCAQPVPFVLGGVCDHCRQGQFFFFDAKCICHHAQPCTCLASAED